MAFVSVEDVTKPKTSPITGVFNSPQNEPAPEGYIGEISDEDPRLIVYFKVLENA